MRDPRKFQLTSGPRGKYVYHISPSGRKVTRNVPNTVMTKVDAMHFFIDTNGRPYRRPNAATRYFMKNGVRVPLPPPPPRRAAPRNISSPIPAPLPCANLLKLNHVEKIGSGRQGAIYRGLWRHGASAEEVAVKVCPFDKAADRRGEKQPAEVEWTIMKTIGRAARGGVLRAMQFNPNCPDFASVAEMNAINKIGKNIDPHRQSVMFMEMATGGPLSKWLVTKWRTISDDYMLEIINKVLGTLHHIMKKFPEFRHNDLYLENILMMRNGTPKIADLGWARLKKTGTNPAVNTALANGTAARYGIGPDTSSRYDMHLFLNELRRLLNKLPGFPRTKAFLARCIPVGYREFNDVYTRDGRLKYGVQLPGLPNLRTILRDPEMRWNRASPSPVKVAPAPKRNANANKAPKRNANANKGPAPKRNANGNGAGPAPRRNYTNNNFIKMTPRTFLALSPRTKARATEIRKAAKGKGPARNNKPRVNSAANATARKRTSPRRAPVRSNVRVSPGTLRSAKFNRFVASLLNMAGSAPYQNRWNAARLKAIAAVENRLRAGKPAFSPSPPRARLPSPLSPLGPPPAPARSPSGVIRSAGSGRYKVTGPSGRLVYADGSTVTMNFLKGLASRKGVNVRGLRSKADIAKAIFNRA